MATHFPAIIGRSHQHFPETHTQSRVLNDEKVYIDIFPEHLSFGCVAAGYVYSLKVSIGNKGPKPQAFRIHCATIPEQQESRLRVKFVPLKVAPGVRQEFSLELIANSTGALIFELQITQGVNKVTVPFAVKALVVPVEVFKHVAKSLTLQKRPIYTDNVVVLGKIGSSDDSRSIVTGRASVLSEEIMDDADLTELMELPLVEGTYWDATAKKIVTDKELCRIIVDCNYTIEESIKRTNEARERRVNDIEDEGNYAESTVRSLTREGGSKFRHSPRQGIADLNNSYLSSHLSKDGADDEPEYPIVHRQVTIQEE